ncbi:MAG: hypothetical protein ACP6IY_09535 [Promethearchaeia archaeon]
MIEEGEKKFWKFINGLNIKIPIKTPYTHVLRELGIMDYDSEEFKIRMIELLYEEFFEVSILKERKK